MSNATINDLSWEKPSSATWALCCKQWHELLTPFAVMSLVSLVLLTTLGFMLFDDPDYYGLMASLPVTISICFIFVCCFISFVSERENRTSSFLVNLPLSSVHVGAVKVFMIVVTVITFCAGQVLMAGIGTWIKLRTEVIPEAQFEKLVNGMFESWQAISFSAVLALVISLVSCSFWSRSWVSVLTAAVLSCYAIFAFANLYDYFYNYVNWRLYYSEIACFAAPLFVLVLGAIWFPLRWLRKQPSDFTRRATAVVDGMSSGFAGAGVVPAPSDKRRWTLFGLPRGGRFGALLWQSFGQQKLTFLFCSFFLIVLVCCGLGFLANFDGGFWGGVLPSLLPALGLTGLGAGWLTLHHDKKDNNFEFFQQQREHGVALLIARIIPPMLLLLLLTGFAFFYKSEMAWRFNSIASGYKYDGPPAVELVLGCVTGFCAALLCSMVFRSQVYALGAALVVALVGGMTITESWVSGTIDTFIWLRWLTALPFIWLISSIAYGPRWLSQRRSWPWTIYFSTILLAAFSLPIFALGCWLLEIEIRP